MALQASDVGSEDHHWAIHGEQSRLGVVQFGTCGHLWNDKMADVRRTLKLRRAVEINTLELSCPVQFGQYLLSDDHVSIILRHQEIL